MKLIPLLFIVSLGYACGALGDKIQPASPPPTPVPNVTVPPSSASNESTHRHPTPEAPSGGILNEKAKSMPQPLYPPAARAVKASGSVSVQVLVDQTGKVVSASAVSGHPLLRAAAEPAARKAEFEPRLLSGNPIKVSGSLTYWFQP